VRRRTRWFVDDKDAVHFLVCCGAPPPQPASASTAAKAPVDQP
jgi:hypothetical protein